MTRRKRVVLAVSLVSFLAVSAVAGYFAIPYFNPREKFRVEMKEKFAQVNDILRRMAKGENQVEHDMQVVFSEDDTMKMRDGVKMTFSIAQDLDESLKQLQHHFEVVSYAFLEQDLDGFDAWGESLVDDYEVRRKRADRWILEVREHPRDIPQYGDVWVYGHENTSDTMDRAEAMLDIRLGAWLESIKARVVVYQQQNPRRE